MPVCSRSKSLLDSCIDRFEAWSLVWRSPRPCSLNEARRRTGISSWEGAIRPNGVREIERAAFGRLIHNIRFPSLKCQGSRRHAHPMLAASLRVTGARVP
jgi:hypothetical protein